MSLIQALATSLSGLNATQTSLAVVAGNVASAQTPGYVDRTAVQVATTTGDSESVRIASINRLLDQFVQQQLRTETSGGAYADLRAGFFQQLQQVYGQPGSDSRLDAVFNKFTTAVQALATSPSSTSAQGATINAAQALAQQLNSATASIQALRTRADQGIAGDVQQVNEALKQIATINEKLAGDNTNDGAAAALADQRDQAIDQLAKLMDIHVVPGSGNQVSVFTGSGTSLVTGNQAAQLAFTSSGNIAATQQWNAKPSKSTLGTVTLQFPDGSSTDLVANKAIRSGEIAAYLDMRDNVLVQAQSQIDEFAAQMSRALSDTTTPGSAAAVGPQSGFDVDIGGVLPGNSIHITYTDAGNVAHNLTIIRCDDPTALPLSNSVTPDPTDTVVGVNFTGGPASVVAQLTAALGATGLQFSNPAGTTLRVLNDVANTITVNNASTTTTATSLTAGGPALPLFLDGAAPFTGAITGAGPESTGFAGRITVNSALLANPTALVAYQPSTPIGDSTRPNFIYNQLVNASPLYSPATGIGGATAPFQGTLSAYLGAVVSAQGQAATTAQNLQSGQDIVVNALKTRFDETAGVNIDTELSHLLTLQNAYGANARVMTTVKQMLDTLLQL
ncbi:MAG TPA: flagellar hook-associated protein FlgK [Xanthobacteraceae bacterium]